MVDPHSSSVCLVTGANGYIGSHVCAALLESRYEVIALDNGEQFDTWFDFPLPRKLSAIVKGDCGDQILLREVFSEHNISHVIHCAGLKNVGESWIESSRYWRTNVSSTIALAEISMEFDVHRFVFSSSCSVYGDIGDVAADESCDLKPLSPYARTKESAERAIADIFRGTSSAVVSLRYFNAVGVDEFYGRDEGVHSLNLIPRTVSAALRVGPPVSVFGDDFDTPDGSCIRDYIDVRDIARAHVMGLEAELGSAQSVFNLGSGIGSSVFEVLSAVERSSGLSVPRTLEPRRPGDPGSVKASSSEAMRTLGWTPLVSLEESIESVVARAKRSWVVGR